MLQAIFKSVLKNISCSKKKVKKDLLNNMVEKNRVYQLKFKRYRMKMQITSDSGLLKINYVKKIGLSLFCLFLGILFLLTSSAFASGAELTNLVIKNTSENLVVDLKIKGVFTEDMKEAVLSGILVSFTFLIHFYEVHDFWFDKKVISIKTIHKIQYKALKNEYRILRSWEKRDQLVVNNFEKARELISEIDGLEVIKLTRLKKGEQYRLKVKAELNDKIYLFFAFPWEFETDWYAINFIY